MCTIHGIGPRFGGAFLLPGDTWPTIPHMEDTEKDTCGNCTFAGRPDEDGLVECRYLPPELFSLNGTVVQLRPRLHPATPACGMHIPQA